MGEREALRFSILGPLEVRREDDVPLWLPRGRARTVLALLCVRTGRVVSRDRLIDAAWNGAPPASAATRLHGFVSELRRALPGDPEPLIRTTGGGYLLAVADDETDVGMTRTLMARARSHRERNDIKVAARCMDDALALWRGPVFDGIECAELQAEAELIEQEYVDGIEELAELELLLGHQTTLVSRLNGWSDRYPLREGLQASLMRALARSGRQAEAIAVYQQLRRRLGDELAVDPAPHIQDLYISILHGDRDVLALRSGAAAVPSPAQLPADTNDFSGRSAQVRGLCDALVPANGPPAAVVVAAISGAGGVGKSTLAVHVAHRMADAFPDGQLYLDLAGTSGDPIPPGAALGGFLRDLGVPEGDVPSDEAERGSRYRSLLAGRKVLLILDDARDAAQVRPLLPGHAGCAVVVTSRSRLADLTGARHVDLDVMPAGEAGELFRVIVGRSRTDAEREATDRVLTACAGLPLAIRIAGAKLTSRPGWSIDSIARMLGLAGTPVLGTGQAGALWDVDSGRAEQLLESLADMHVLQAPAPGVYRMHDLLRLFAIELAGTQVSPDERDLAVARLLTWYAHALRSAGRALAQGRSGPPEAEPLPPWTGADIPVFATHKAALDWCQAEYPALVWGIAEAARRQRPGLAADMACWMWMYATRAAIPASHVDSQRIGLECARALNSERVQAWLLIGMGSALAKTRDYERAADCYQQSLDLRRSLSDDAGVAASRNNIGNIRHEQGRYADAVQEYLAAAEAAESCDRQHHLGTILANAANSYREMGAYTEAQDTYSRALEIHRNLESWYDVASCRSGLGEILRLRGRLTESLEQHELAIAFYRDLGTSDRHLADALSLQARAYFSCGRFDDAQRCRAEAASLTDGPTVHARGA
jgi:DNA-binding SARP family transcriptional activator